MYVCELIENISNKTLPVYIFDSDDTLLPSTVKAFRLDRDERVIELIDFDYANECITIYIA